jgi:hypothetical protein
MRRLEPGDRLRAVKSLYDGIQSLKIGEIYTFKKYKSHDLIMVEERFHGYFAWRFVLLNIKCPICSEKFSLTNYDDYLCESCRQNYE